MSSLAFAAKPVNAARALLARGEKQRKNFPTNQTMHYFTTLASLPRLLLLLCLGEPPRDEARAAAAWRAPSLSLRAALASLLWVMSHARTPLTSRLSEETMPCPGTSWRAMAWSATSTARPQPGSRALKG